MTETADRVRALHVSVHAPRDPKPKHFTFRPEDTVGEAAQEAARRFGYRAGQHSFQNHAGDVLDRALTLQAAHVHDHDEVELVEAGGGV